MNFRYLSRRRAGFDAVAGLVLLAIGMSFVPATGEVNETVKELAPMLTPGKANAKIGPADAKNLRNKLIKILNFVNESDISEGPQTKDLVRNAYEWHHRDKMGAQRILMTSTTIVNAWRAAKSLGLFDEEFKFQPVITKGWDEGRECVFEYIVPPEHIPEFSNDLANIRIVASSEARRRRPSQELTIEEKNYLDVLRGLKKEAVEGVPVDIARTAVEARAEWLREVKEAGEDFKKRPNVLISGGISGTPSNQNNRRWRVSLEAKNISHHPTKIQLQIHIFGISEKENTVFLMAKHSEKIELRKTHVWKKDFFTLPEKDYVDLVKELDKGSSVGSSKGKKAKKEGPNIEIRGWVAVLRHEGQFLASDASQRYMERHLEEVSYMPRVGKKTK